MPFRDNFHFFFRACNNQVLDKDNQTEFSFKAFRSSWVILTQLWTTRPINFGLYFHNCFNSVHYREITRLQLQHSFNFVEREKIFWLEGTILTQVELYSSFQFDIQPNKLILKCLRFSLIKKFQPPLKSDVKQLWGKWKYEWLVGIPCRGTAALQRRINSILLY